MFFNSKVLYLWLSFYPRSNIKLSSHHYHLSDCGFWTTLVAGMFSISITEGVKYAHILQNPLSTNFEIAVKICKYDSDWGLSSVSRPATPARRETSSKFSSGSALRCWPHVTLCQWNRWQTWKEKCEIFSERFPIITRPELRILVMSSLIESLFPEFCFSWVLCIPFQRDDLKCLHVTCRDDCAAFTLIIWLH